MLGRLKGKFINWLLKDAHLKEIHIGEHSVVISGTGAAMGDTKVSAMAAPVAAGDALRKGTPITTTELPALASGKVWAGNVSNRPAEEDKPAGDMAKAVYDPDLDGKIALAQLVDAVCSEAEADGKITTHKGDASAHHTKTTAAGDITSGRFGVARLPAMTDEKIWKGTGNNVEEVDAPIAPGFTHYASDDLRNSNEPERTTTSATYVKVKECKLNADLAGCRIKFTLQGSGLGCAKAKVYKNGVAIGAEALSCDAAPQTQSEDFLGFVKDDLIQIYAQKGSAGGAKVKFFRFYYIWDMTKIGGFTLVIPIDVTDDPTISITNQDP